MKFYISGQISGLSRPVAEHKFKLAEMLLITLGYDALNPFNIPNHPCICDGTTPVEQGGHSWRCCLSKDIAKLVYCDGIYMLDGWEWSEGAKLELRVATGLKLKVKYETELK